MDLDPGRLSDLRVFSRVELEQISADTIAAIAAQLDALERAFSAGDLTAAAEAAHQARNETLAIGAREMSDVFGSLERAANEGRAAPARAASGQAREIWPQTRAAIAGLAAAVHDAG
jgi:hypothetical protein